MTDIYQSVVTTQWNDFDYFGDGTFISDVSEESDDVISEYNLQTPAKLNIGASVFIGTSGFITADVEMINYPGAKYSSDISGITFNSDNETINELYQPTVNYRIGGEYRFNNFRFRAGYAYMPDPFKSEQNGISRKMNSFSTGLGYRNKKFYSDLAVVFTQGKNSYRPYTLNSVDSPLVTLTNQATLSVLTVGFSF
ncbi:MAG: outer membrane protein transport protein [Flammeovirgaceae bacterium]|nr:outer membrane protein transport protein [Flammeovirgaceae bacterium]